MNAPTAHTTTGKLFNILPNRAVKVSDTFCLVDHFQEMYWDQRQRRCEASLREVLIVNVIFSFL